MSGIYLDIYNDCVVNKQHNKKVACNVYFDIMHNCITIERTHSHWNISNENNLKDLKDTLLKGHITNKEYQECITLLNSRGKL